MLLQYFRNIHVWFIFQVLRRHQLKVVAIVVLVTRQKHQSGMKQMSYWVPYQLLDFWKLLVYKKIAVWRWWCLFIIYLTIFYPNNHLLIGFLKHKKCFYFSLYWTNWNFRIQASKTLFLKKQSIEIKWDIRGNLQFWKKRKSKLQQVSKCSTRNILFLNAILCIISIRPDFGTKIRSFGQKLVKKRLFRVIKRNNLDFWKSKVSR